MRALKIQQSRASEPLKGLGKVRGMVKHIFVGQSTAEVPCAE